MNNKMFNNPYLPEIVNIDKITIETPDIKTFRLSKREGIFRHQPGQFMEVSVFGVGEAPISISSYAGESGFIELSLKKVGTVTAAIHDLKVGDKIGVRGPYGNNFPYELAKGKNLLFIGGGIGLAPLRSLIHYVFNHRQDYGKISILYGARTYQDLVFKEELFNIWPKMLETQVHTTLDVRSEGWEGKVGVVPKILRELNPQKENTVTFTCGPPIMIKYTLEALKELGFSDENIITTLEMKMKCGIGKCGRCNIGDKFVCLDGPVFSLKELKAFPQEF